MPNIQTYSAPIGQTPEPTDMAAGTAREAGLYENRFLREGGDALGGAISRVGGQLGAQVDDHIAGQMISHGALVSSQLTANLTKQISDTMSQADLNDTSVGQGQRENVAKSIQNFQDQFADAPQKVQDWARATANHLQEHFGNSITAYEMERSAGAAHQNLNDTYRANANSVALDPSSLQGMIAKQKFDRQTYFSTHTLPLEAQVQLREMGEKADSNLAYIAAQTIGVKNPTALNQLLSDGTYDKWLGPQQKEQLTQFAQRQQMFAHEQDTWAYTQQKRTEDLSAQTAKQEAVTAIMSGKNPGQYWNDPRLQHYGEDIAGIKRFQQDQIRFSEGQQEHGLRMQEAGNPVELRTLVNQIHDQYNSDPNNVTDKPLWDKYKSGAINYSDLLRGEAAYHQVANPLERSWNTQLRTVENTMKTSPMTAGMALQDPVGYANKINQIDQDFHTTLQMYRSEGKDVTPLVTPSSPSYFLSPGNVARYFAGSGKAGVATQADAIRKGGPQASGTIGAPASANDPGADARAAIAAGADKAKVAARYKQMTGKDL